MTKLTSAGVAQTATLVPEVASAALDAADSGGFPASVPFPRWQRARDRACAALLAGETRLLLTGPPGTGKTALVQEIARILRYAGWQAAVRTAGLPPANGVAALTGQQTVLLIDEADRLSDPELRDLEASPHGALVLAGLDAIGIRWEAGARISLSPLSPAEARDYAAQWLNLAGEDGRFPSDAVERVVSLGAGVPRLLSSLLGASIWIAAADGVGSVTPSHVDAAAALRACFIEPEPDIAETTQVAAQPEPSPPASPEAAAFASPEVVPQAAAPARRRRVLIPALAACLVAAASVGIGAYRLSPERAEHWAAAVRAKVTAHLASPKPPESTRATPAPELAMSTPPAAQEPVAAATPVEAVTNAAPDPVPPAAGPMEATQQPPSTPDQNPPAALSAAPPAAEQADATEQPRPMPEQTPAISERAQVTEQERPIPEQASPSAEQTDAKEQPAPTPVPTPARQEAQTPVTAPQQTAALAPDTARPQLEAARPAPTNSLPPALIETLLRRGNEMLTLGDFASAQLLFARAAEAGNVTAMVALGRMYDPASPDPPGAHPAADPLAAANWYRQAAALGNAEAATRLHQIEQQAAK